MGQRDRTLVRRIRHEALRLLASSTSGVASVLVHDGPPLASPVDVSRGCQSDLRITSRYRHRRNTARCLAAPGPVLVVVRSRPAARLLGWLLAKQTLAPLSRT